MNAAVKLRRAVTLEHWDHPQRILMDRFVARVAKEVPPGGCILDAGAGECPYALAFAHCDYIACDRAVGDAAWDYTRLAAVSDLASLPFRPETFHAILCAHVLEHVGEPAAALRDMATVLKSGGRLYLSVPFLGDPIHQEPYDFFRYTHYGLRHLIEQAGLTPVSIAPMGGVFLLLCEHLWWCAVAYKTARRDRASRSGRLAQAAYRVFGTGMLLAARFCTMLTVTLKQTERASQRFTCGYTVVAEKQSAHERSA